MAIIPEADGSSYTATCDDCRWSMTVGSEPFAEEMLEDHHRFAQHAEAKAALVRYAALPPTADPNDQHLHGGACTDVTCPGMGFPTRDELVSRRRAQHRGPAGVPATTPVDETPNSPREVPV